MAFKDYPGEIKMNKAFLVILIFISFQTNTLFSQYKNFKLGAGYFGETATHPGLVLEAERESRFARQAGIIMRLDLGFYSHPRSHNALFIDISQGLRRYFDNGLFLEQYIGLGVMAVFYNEDVWHIDSNGDAVRVSKFGNFDFMPSLTTGLGYVPDKNTSKRKLLWIRPKIFWQLPFNTHSVPHVAVQAGLTYTFKSNEKEK